MARRKRRSPAMLQRERVRTIERRRRVVAALALVPLGGIVLCGAGVEPFCAIPTFAYLLMWSALIGSFAGLTIRLIRERRSQQRGGPARSR